MTQNGNHVFRNWELNGGLPTTQGSSTHAVAWKAVVAVGADGGGRFMLCCPLAKRIAGWSPTGEGWFKTSTMTRSETHSLVEQINRWP